ncbi:LOW QUALITY PROTEIN: Cleavage inducible protein, partial [Phytophthora megakarya]
MCLRSTRLATTTYNFSASEWNMEDGYPCSHRGPRQYLVEPNVTWKKLWERYARQAEAAYRRSIGYCRFTQYVHFYFPGIRLSRSQTDVCDACVRIDTTLLRRDLTDVERSELLAEKAVHVEAPINQRRAMTQFVKEYAATHAPQQQRPEEVIAEHVEVPLMQRITDQRKDLTLQIQIDDFGGSLPLPVYGHKQPSADYYNSNLMLHNFVVADITTGRNAVYIYDERAQGKGADALCSLRMLHHLRVRERYGQNGAGDPENTITLLQVLDNCVGQNKSRSVFMFYAMLSLVFYKKVVLLFLLPGHSHNTADRVVAWCKRKLKGENLYVPEQVVKKMNETNSVEAEFLDHRKSGHPFYCGWDVLLARYFKRMPDGYTGNYFFEIDRGVVSIRHLVTTDDQEVKTHSLIGNGDPLSIKKAFLSDLAGEERLTGCVTMPDLRLQRQPPLTLTMKKRKSLAL